MNFVAFISHFTRFIFFVQMFYIGLQLEMWIIKIGIQFIHAYIKHKYGIVYTRAWPHWNVNNSNGYECGGFFSISLMNIRFSFSMNSIHAVFMAIKSILPLIFRHAGRRSEEKVGLIFGLSYALAQIWPIGHHVLVTVFVCSF